MEAQPDKVHLWCTLRKTTWFHRHPPSNRGQPEEDQSHHGHECTRDYQGCLEAYRLHGSLEQIPLPTWRMGITLLQAPKATRQVPVET